MSNSLKSIPYPEKYEICDISDRLTENFLFINISSIMGFIPIAIIKHSISHFRLLFRKLKIQEQSLELFVNTWLNFSLIS